MNRRTLTLTLAALMVLSLSVAAYAGQGRGGGPGFGCPGWGGQGGQGGYKAQALSPEQQEKLDILRTEHLNKVAPLRKDIYAKHYELEALMVDPGVNGAKIKSLSKELGALKGRLFQERVGFRAELIKLGVESYGRGSMGPGFGRRHGGRGLGSGNCPGFGPGQGFGPGMGMGPGADNDPMS